jgi:hypothetical protein
MANKSTYHVIDGNGKLVRSTPDKNSAEAWMKLQVNGSIIETVEHEIIFVSHVPNCDFCNQEGKSTPGPYDFKTRYGPWGHGCEAHWKLYRAFDSLGTGNGQIWIQRPEKVTA